MAKTKPQHAPTWVALEVVLAAFAAAGWSPEGAYDLVIEGCAAPGGIRWRARSPLDPPATSWRGHPSNFTFARSDVTNRAAPVVMRDGLVDLCAVTLRNVQLAWEDVAARCPELGAAPAPPPPRTTKATTDSKKPRPRVAPQTERARKALQSLYPDGRIPGHSELSDLALTGQVEDELKRMAKASGTSARLPFPSEDVVRKLRKEFPTS
jgi:hypothetical protein